MQEIIIVSFDNKFVLKIIESDVYLEVRDETEKSRNH